MSRFEPLAVEARAPAPRARVDPDASKGWIRRLWPVLAAHKKLVMGALGAALASVAAGVSVPRVLMAAIDTALIERSAPLLPFVLALGVLGLAGGAASYAFRYGMARTSQAIEYELRALIYTHLSGLSFEFYDRVQTGQLISRANADIRAVQMFLGFAPSIAMSGLQFAVALGLMLSIHPLLALVAVSTLPGVYLIGKHMRGQLFPISWVIQARRADVATLVEENVTGVRIVKAFGAEREELGRMARAAERLRWSVLRQVGIRARFAPVLTNLPRVGRALVLLYGGWLAIGGQVTVGALVAFNSYIAMLQAPFQMLGALLIMGQRAAASAMRIFEILDERPSVKEKPGARPLEVGAGAVELDGVGFGYRDGPDILRGLDLSVRPGETLALVGRTGSGKSSLVRLLPRFYDVRDGAVRIDGVDVRDVTLASLRAQVGLVLDEPFLFSDTLRNNIAYARPDATLEEVAAAARAAGADRFIRALPEGYDTMVGERGYTLSGGQRQRIAIARTLLADPPVLVLDDATSSLDVKVEQQIHEALRRLTRDRTTIVIAHRLSTIALADRVALLEDGRIAALGTHAELLRDVPAYAEILTRVEREHDAARRRTPPPAAAARAPRTRPQAEPPPLAIAGIDLPEASS